MLRDIKNYMNAFGICAKVFFFFMFFMTLIGLCISLYEILVKY